MPGTWISLANKPSFNAGHMLLLTDGTVMVQEAGSSNWHSLIPDSTGSYVNGRWSQLASSVMSSGSTSVTYAPTFYASALLADGTVFFAGGEDDGGNSNSCTCALYDPTVANGGKWTLLPSPTLSSGKFWIADAPCCVLPDGRVLLGATAITESPFQPGTATAIFDPKAFAQNPNQSPWTAGPDNPGTNWEQTWTLLPDGTVLAPSIPNAPSVYKFLIDASGPRWVPAGSPLQSVIIDTETGPSLLLLDGTVLCFGATPHNALYTAPAHPADAGTWSSAPDFPTDSSGNSYSMSDAPVVLLPNGKAFCPVGVLRSSGHSGPPAQFVEFTPAQGSAGSFQTVDNPPCEQRPAGETAVVAMAHRNGGNGASGDLEVYLCGYSFALDPTKTVQSITLPANRNVIVMSMALVAANGQATNVSLASVANVTGACPDGASFSGGGLDGDGFAYSSNLLGTSQTYSGTTMSLGTNGVSGATVSLPSGSYATLKILATAVNGTQSAQPFTVNYKDGSSTQHKQTLSDWAFGYETEAFSLLLLPTGEVMATVGSTDVAIYRPDANPAPPASAAPLITNGPTLVRAGEKTVRLDGTQFNGLSQANSFGDDASNATNYPLVRIVNPANGHVRYCRTYNHSTMGVATGAATVTTYFDVPSDVETGSSRLYVVANGIESEYWPLDVVAAAGLGRMQAKLASPTPPLHANQLVTFTVHAWDSLTNATIHGNVLVDNVFVGHTDTAITHEFRPTVSTFRRPQSSPIFVEIVQKATYPKCTVSAPGYSSAAVDLGFKDTYTVTQEVLQTPKP